MSSTETHSLAMSTIAFDQYLGLTGKRFAELAWVTELRTEMVTVLPLFVAHLAAWTGLVSNFACIFVTLEVALVST